MLSVLLVPVIKNKAGMVGNLDNYRPIALPSILSKVLEIILLDRLNVFINSTDTQFGFKAKHGTDLCIYALKEIVHKYRDKKSSVFMRFIDASKAFDQVTHAKLFFKMRQRGVPEYMVRILVYWYGQERINARASRGWSPGAYTGKGAHWLQGNYIFIIIYMGVCSSDNSIL